jgi:hypothetical protein
MSFWQLTAVNAGSHRLTELLQRGWEPFAVGTGPLGPEIVLKTDGGVEGKGWCCETGCRCEGEAMRRIRAGETPTLEFIFERISQLQHDLESDMGRTDPYDHRGVLYLRRELVAVLRMLAGERRANARLSQRWENVARELASVVHRKAGARREIVRLEELLRWIYKTEQPINEIRATIERTIPRQFKDEAGG